MTKLEGLSDAIKSLLPDYLANREVELIRLKELLMQGDLIEIKKIGHKLAGNAGSYGLTELGNLGVNLEEAVKIEEAESLIREYENLLESYLKTTKQ